MAGSTLKIAGNKLRIVAGLAENPVTGNLIKAKMKRQLSLPKIWNAKIAEDESPWLVPAHLGRISDQDEGGARS